MVVMPVVVEMRVASVIGRPANAAVEVETAMRPGRDTSETSGRLLISGCRHKRSPSTRFVHLFCALRLLRDLSVTGIAPHGSNEVDFFS